VIYWITGKSSSGKTTYAYRLKDELENHGHNILIFDGDDVRQYFKDEYNDNDRETHIMRIAKFAAIAESQGFVVIISLISPLKIWRMKARKLFKKSMLIYLPGGTLWEGTNYEVPDGEEVMCGGG